MALEQNAGRLTFVNIKEGKLYIKPKDGEIQFFDAISGTISKVEFQNDEFNGQKFERAKIILVDGEDRFLLQMRTDSGYFRGFCNSLKTGNPLAKLRISTSYKEENGKPKTTCFVQQDGKALKHFHTKDNPGDLPQVKMIKFKGQDVWDGTEQVEYWKNWLLSISFENEFISSFGKSQLDHKPSNSVPTPDDITEPISDLPF